jgi:hypothetical protein
MTALVLKPANPGIAGTGFSFLSWRNTRSLSTGDTNVTLRYLESWGARYGQVPGTTATARRSFIYAPRAGTLKNLMVCHVAAAPAVTTTYTIYVNSVATALLVSSGSLGTVVNTTDSVAVSANDLIQVVASFATGTPNSTSTRPQVTVILT